MNPTILNCQHFCSQMIKHDTRASKGSVCSVSEKKLSALCKFTVTPQVFDCCGTTTVNNIHRGGGGVVGSCTTTSPHLPHHCTATTLGHHYFSIFTTILSTPPPPVVYKNCQQHISSSVIPPGGFLPTHPLIYVLSPSLHSFVELSSTARTHT